MRAHAEPPRHTDESPETGDKYASEPVARAGIRLRTGVHRGCRLRGLAQPEIIGFPTSRRPDRYDQAAAVVALV